MHVLFPELLNRIDKETNKEQKIQILRNNGIPAYKGLLRINFDETVSMNLPEGEPPFKKQEDRPIGYQDTNLIQEFRRFYIWLDPKQKLSQMRKEALFIEMLENLHLEEAVTLCLVKDRKLQQKYKTVTYDLVQEAFPDLLPPKPKKVKRQEENLSPPA